MKSRKGALAVLLILATCDPGSGSPTTSETESSCLALGTVPPSEVATWTRVAFGNTPDGRYLQATALDEDRNVVVIFGGASSNPRMPTVSLNQETWEWSPATGKWTNRTSAGAKPDARSGAAFAYDSDRKRLVLFGGRAGSGYNFEDTWEWDPATGVWTSLTNAGTHPAARSQHAMVYEKSTKKVLLFGGGRSDASSFDSTGISIALGDTWEWDAATNTWTARTATPSPSPRHDLGLVWDSVRNRAVLFGGLEMDIAGASGAPKQDTWEWDPETSAWTERTFPGFMPGPRHGHATGFDGANGRVVVFGGSDIVTGAALNDLWIWDPPSGMWKQVWNGSEPGLPGPRMYAAMVSGGAHLQLVCGAITAGGGGTGGTGGKTTLPPDRPYGTYGTNDIWELDPATLSFTNRTAAPDIPLPRSLHAMASDPTTGRVFVFGGSDLLGRQLDDLWEWDGKSWTQIVTDEGPAARASAAMAYDPARSTILLFGGSASGQPEKFDDTWELHPASRKWALLSPKTNADPLSGHAMVTDTTRGRVILFGGMGNMTREKDPMRKDIWEWDGAQETWTKRTPAASTASPTYRSTPLLAYDDGRQKVILYDGPGNPIGSPTAFWEWDPISAGWSIRDPQDGVSSSYSNVMAFDGVRKRAVILTEVFDPAGEVGQTWELDTRGPTFYVRTLSGSPAARTGAAMVFEPKRGTVVLFGGQILTGNVTNETWEYRVTGWGNGTGCAANSPSSCASGNCVEGVCCDVAQCSGPCKSCNAAGSEGTCVLATAGTEVPGSCAGGQACDGSGNCKSMNGTSCTSPDVCASGICADGVCCDTACSGTCSSCNQPGLAGKCSPHQAGTDPESECGQGTGVCKSTCDGVGSCAYPRENVVCGQCLGCDGAGTCSYLDKYCVYASGGAPGRGGATGMAGMTGAGGMTTPGRGGAGGGTSARGGAGGSGGTTTARGGSGGTGATTGRGGAGGGTATARGGSGGTGATTGRGGAGGTGGRFTTGGAISTGGRTTASGGTTSPGSGFGGTGGKRDAGVTAVPDASPGAISSARLHRSGCDCDVRGAPYAGAGSGAPLLLAGLALLARRRCRRRP